MNLRKVILAGLPETGKTTYLAVLYHSIVRNRAGGLSLGALTDDREHVNEISARLGARESADRTHSDDEKDVRLSLTVDEETFELQVPDLSGETWRDAHYERRWPDPLEELIRDADGFMVFAHSTEVETGLQIVDVAKANEVFGVDDGAVSDPQPDAGNGNDETDDDDADYEELPERKQLTQVSVLELIQHFAARARRPIRVSVVISAWDHLVKHSTPDGWIDENAQLLRQFLDANPDEVEVRAFGVSAQGYDYENEKEHEENRGKDLTDLAKVWLSDGSEAGIAAPLRWVLRLDQ